MEVGGGRTRGDGEREETFKWFQARLRIQSSEEQNSAVLYLGPQRNECRGRETGGGAAVSLFTYY